MKKVRKVARSHVVDNFETEKRKFVLNASFNWKPVKRVKKRTDVRRSEGLENQAGSIVLDFL